MKVPGVKPHSSALSAGPVDLPRHSSSQLAVKLADQQKNWLHNSVAQVGVSELTSGALESVDVVAPKRAALVPLPPRKPSQIQRDARLEVAQVLSNPKTEQARVTSQLWFAPGNPGVSTKEMRALVDQLIDQGGDFADVLNDLIKKKGSAAQLIDVVDEINHADIDKKFIESSLAALGYPSPDAWLKSLEESTVMHARSRLNERGFRELDGRGVKTWILEPASGPHAESVKAVINDPKYGLAPGATVEVKHLYEALDVQQLSDKVAASLVANDFKGVVERLTAQLNEDGADVDRLFDQLEAEFGPVVSKYFDLTDNRVAEQVRNFAESDAQVLNLSMGRNLRHVFKTTYDLAYLMVDTSPKLAEAIVDNEPNGMELINRDVIASQVARVLFYTAYPVLSAPLNSSGLSAYIEATKAAAEKGKIITVAAANDHITLNEFVRKTGISYPDSIAFNPYAMSPHVVAVGASKTNGTPLDPSDDTMAPYSSRGSYEHPLTVVTQGDVAVPYQIFVELGGRNAGTSFSGPTTGALANLYKQVRPEGDVVGFKEFLKEHSATSLTSHAVGREVHRVTALDLLNASTSLGEELDAR